MRRIRKGREPKAWREYRLSTPGARYVDAPKDELRRALLSEQGYICCYCMCRIGETTTRIEHRQPREAPETDHFEYRNLFAACQGGEGMAEGQQHCDVHKRSSKISFDPADTIRDIEALVQYSPNSGEIRSENDDIHKDINTTLNLNLERLKQARIDVLDGFRAGFERKHGGEWSADVIEREITKWSEAPQGGKLAPYCGIVVYYLRKRLRAAAMHGTR